MASGKQIARQIFQQTLSSIDIPRVMARKIAAEGDSLIFPTGRIDLSGVTCVQVVAVGKAAHAMVDGLLQLLPGKIEVSGVVAAPTPPMRPATGVRYFVAGHPTPDLQSWEAAESALELLGSCDEQALIFFLLSGGGSALFELPLDAAITLEEVQSIHRALVTCGAPIEEMNAVRKHLSAVKGGRLAVAAGRARKVTLAVTDVPAGHESALASGPSLPDPSTIADVARILSQYGLRARLPERVLRWVDSGKMTETPKPSEAAFDNADFLLLLDMDDLFHAAHHAAEAHGYITLCDNTTDDWQVERAAEFLLAQLEDWRRENPRERVALIADGEISSPVTGNGIGGRNSAFVLSCVEKIAGRKITVLSAGTDGIDGNSPGAGAVADGESLARAKSLRLDAVQAFRQSDAFSFFSRLNDAVVTGPTGNNLRDLRILLADP